MGIAINSEHNFLIVITIMVEKKKPESLLIFKRMLKDMFSESS